MFGSSFDFVIDVLKTRFLRVMFFIFFPFGMSFPISYFFQKSLGEDFKVYDFLVNEGFQNLSFEFYVMAGIIFLLYSFYFFTMIVSAINAYNNKYDSIKTKFTEHALNSILFFIWFTSFFIIIFSLTIFILMGKDNIHQKIISHLNTIEIFVSNPDYVNYFMIIIDVFAILLLIWFFIRFMFTFYSIAEEKKDIMTAAFRSFKITRGSFFKLAGIISFYGIIFFAIDLFSKYTMYKMTYKERITENMYTPIDILWQVIIRSVYDFPGFKIFKYSYFLWISFYVVMLFYIFTYIYKDLKYDKGLEILEDKKEAKKNNFID